jgi:hypothetical protein
MKRIYVSLTVVLISIFTNHTAAQLGQYDFATNGTACPHNPNTTVITQPTNATFSPYISVGTSCAQSNYQFNNSGWETTSTVNTSEYNEFTITANTHYLVNLTSISFGHRTNSLSFCNYHLRSSLDNYAADIATGQTTDTWDYPTVTLTGFTNLSTVTFRFYVTDIGSSADQWRQDDVIVNGTTVADGAGIEELTKTIKMYPNPGSDIIHFESLEETDFLSLSVYRIDGLLIDKKSLIGSNSYDASMLASGNYFLSFETSEGTHFQNWIKN